MHSYWDRKAKMIPGSIIFSQGDTTYKMRDDKIVNAEPKFRGKTIDTFNHSRFLFFSPFL